ncbi:hypothetical protein SDC9_175754 [bioreactor metagenome]|uniref:Uncharacterized protein n=1 Tax=bioreactor metagenome TaxID=1076179 RepID=A0A645GXC9_9ZZZZ
MHVHCHIVDQAQLHIFQLCGKAVRIFRHLFQDAFDLVYQQPAVFRVRCERDRVSGQFGGELPRAGAHTYTVYHAHLLSQLGEQLHPQNAAHHIAFQVKPVLTIRYIGILKN